MLTLRSLCDFGLFEIVDFGSGHDYWYTFLVLLRSAIEELTVCEGVIMEFTGAVLAGSRVTGTIKNDIIAIEAFEIAPSVLMLAMLCALIGSSTFLTLATKIGMPVSTNHCIIGGIIGVGFATVGANGIDWSWEGVSQVFAAWGIAPCISGIFGAILFTFTKYGVMKAKNPLLVGMITVPFFYALTSGILTMLIVWKGAASLDLDDWGITPTVGTIMGVAVGVALLSCIFLLPYIHVKLVREDWKLKTWDIIKGPLLLRRPAAGPLPDGHMLVPDYYAGHATHESIATDAAMHNARRDEESARSESNSGSDEKSAALYAPQTDIATTVPTVAPAENIIPFFFRGVMIDVVDEQKATSEPKFLQRLLLGKNLDKKHAIVEYHDLKVEHLYSFLQVMTAATAAFAHGANDVSNAMGPLAAIYGVWQTNTTGEDSEVPICILIFGGAAIAIGLWTYGYNLMRNLGNRITLHSPSRGFCMELGAALTVVMTTRSSLPVSTTQCIIGATVGVGLCAGDVKAINWRMVIWAYAGWFITLPCTALISGCLLAFVINAPSWAAPL
ncbi:Na+/Pi symporter [Oleoguttula sp. CCFEE 5521]